ncbi:MAG TPA: sulfotransferase domain-containing protein [Anaerolineales bacterium]|nr:sulfotransferase domain-containing protein [Anaerolineales bacterium]
MNTPALNLKLLRHRLRRATARLRHGPALDGAPVLFANAFPKSGTHLLVQILKAVPRLGPAVDSGLPAIAMYEGENGAPRPIAAVLRDLARMRPGDVAFGHLHALPEITAALDRSNAAVFFLYRDLRDAAVSHAHYVTEIETDHVHHAHYRSLPDFDARLRTSILGRPELGGLFPDIGARFAPYLGWFDAPGVLPLRFEELIKDRKSKIENLLDHLEIFDFRSSILDRPKAIDLLMASVDPARSPTFRTGKTGGWRARFSEEHKALFKEVAGELLIELGYEEDLSW